jgi:sigma-B regulation protein RsbU (phosphoserine phosphatase)
MALTWEPPEAIVLDPSQETERLESLRSLNLLENVPEDRFDRVTRLAGQFFKVPMAYVAFIESERQWFKSSFGVTAKETTRRISLCQYTIQLNEPLVIFDATLHPIARTHPMVTGEPGIRFYAGIPLKGPRGQKIGTFCVLDVEPRSFSESDIEHLKAFATIVEREVNLAGIIQTQNELLRTRQELVETQARLKHEFDDATKYVRLMLPPPLSGRESIDWIFEPSTQLGGDGLGYRRISADQIAFYVLDVTGHGVGSALLAVTALEFLRSQAVRALDFSSPAEVMDRLNRTFQMKQHAGKFFSVWYGVYSHSKRQVTYANAGHPPALLLTWTGDRPVLTKTEPGGPTLGVLPETETPERTIDFPKGSELHLFTDGLYEVLDGKKGRGSHDEFLAHLETQVREQKPLYDAMLQWLDRARAQGTIDDDVSLLRFMTKR